MSFITKNLWLLLLFPLSTFAMDGDLGYIQQQNPVGGENQPQAWEEVDIDSPAQSWYDKGFNKVGTILNRMTGNGGPSRGPDATTWERVTSLASGFALPFYFAATSRVPFRRLPGFAFRNVLRNMAVGTLLFGGATAVNTTAGAGLLGESLGKNDKDNLKKAHLIGRSGLSFIDKELSLGTFFIEQLVHPVFLSSCLGGGLWTPALVNVVHSSMTASVDRNRAHRAGIMAGLVTGLLLRYRNKVFLGMRQEIGRLLFQK